MTRTPLWLMLTLLGTAALASPAGALPPFFDKDPATRHAPEPPPLTDFDLEVLLLCGDWGGEVQARDFESMLLRPGNAEVLQRLRQALGDRIYGKAESREEFVRQLRRAWFEQKGFKHVFCGEPGIGADLGGFHYAPRYWQAQDRGWAGYRPLARSVSRRPLEKCRKPFLQERIQPPVYSVGVEFRNPNRPANKVKCLSGYNRLMGAEDILIAGTQAFKQANRRSGKNATESCLFETHRPQVPSHFSTLVIKRRALRTFYPRADRHPYCPKDKKDLTACLCTRL